MIAEGIEAFKKLAQDAGELRKFEISKRHKLHVFVEGVIREFDMRAEPMVSRVDSLNSFCNAAAHYRGSSSTIWHGTTDVILVIDEEDRRNRVWLKIRQSEQFERIILLDTETSGIEHSAFIRLLRHDLSGAIDPGVLAAVRKVRFTSGVESKMEREHEKQSFGKQVSAAVASTDGIPESCKLSLPLFATSGLRVIDTISMSLDVDIRNELFWLKPFPEEIEKARAFGQEETGRKLRECPELDDIPIFCGSPDSALNL